MAGRGDGSARASAAAAALPLGAALGRARLQAQGYEWRAWLRGCWAREVEQRRLFPWIAVAFGLGILLFFTAEGRPSLWAPLGGAGVFGVAAFLARARPVGFGVAVGLTALFSGFAAAVIRTRSVDAPILARTVISPLTGFVESIECPSSDDLRPGVSFRNGGSGSSGLNVRPPVRDAASGGGRGSVV
jgi:competence protein ComEC